MPSLRFLQHQAADNRQERTQAASASAAAAAAQSKLRQRAAKLIQHISCWPISNLKVAAHQEAYAANPQQKYIANINVTTDILE